MNNHPADKDKLRTLQVDSIGRLLAGFSHDMKNHLGIIRESNGLIGDVLDFGQLSGDENTVSRLKNAVESVERRIEIAAEMLHHLSGFSHRSDAPYSSFDLNGLLVETHTFLNRFIRLKQVEFVFIPGENIPALYNSPSLLQHLMYRIYMYCLENVEAGDVIELQTSYKDGTTHIDFIMKNVVLAEEEGEKQLAFLTETFKQLKFSLKFGQVNETGSCISIEAPSVQLEKE